MCDNRAEIAKLIAKGHVRLALASDHVESPSPAKFVRNSANEFELVTDYRVLFMFLKGVNLRHLLKAVKFERPTTAAVREKISKNRARYYTKLSIVCSNHHLILDDAAQLLSAFELDGKVYVWKIMPYGLEFGPAYWNKFMDEVLGELQDSCIQYFDEILIMGLTRAELELRTGSIFGRLHDHQVEWNTEKSQFEVEEVQFLGLSIISGGVKIPAEVAQALSSLSEPKSKQELQHFMDVSEYYKAFVPHFAEHTESLRALLERS